MTYPVTGTCQCGQVQYKVAAPPVMTVICHCIDCQKLSASAFSMSMMLNRDDFEILQGELKIWNRPAASGNTARCYFCPDCGNRIYHENPDRPEVIRLKPGTLDDTSIIKPTMHCWTKRAQDWVELPSDMPCYEAQPEVSEFLKI